MKTYKFWETLDFKKFPDGTRFKDNEGEIWEIISDNKEKSVLSSEKTGRMIIGNLENAKKEFTKLPYAVSFKEMLKIVLNRPGIKVTIKHEFIDEEPKCLDQLMSVLGEQLDATDLAEVLLNGKWSLV